MEQQDDPYEILGVAANASDSQIRSAYRKAALRSHPDKVSAEERPAANIRFAKISNAYEILSDPQKRAQYDLQQQEGIYYHGSQQQQQQDPSYARHDHPFGFDPFFARGFHDPFQVFQSVFREEFGGPQASFGGGRHYSSRRAAAPQFPLDAFFGDPFFGGGGNDDFFGPSLFGGGGGARGGMFDYGRGGFGGGSSDIHRRRSSRDPFEDMFASMHSMQRQMEEQMQNQLQNNGNNNHQSFYYSSSSSSAGPGGESVTTQTTRRIVNGQEQVLTERIVRKADGTIERQVLDNRNGGDGSSSLLQQQQQQQQDDGGRAVLPADDHDRNGFSRLLPWGRRRSSCKQQQKSDDLTPAKRSPAEADSDSQKRRREP